MDSRGLGDGDRYLRWLLALVDVEPDLRVELCLDMGGAIYSGTVISRREYAARMRGLVFTVGLPERLHDLLDAPFGTMHGLETTPAPGVTPDLATEIDRADHVHLADYTTLQGGRLGDVVDRALWRGSVDRVVGWRTVGLSASVG